MFEVLPLIFGVLLMQVTPGPNMMAVSSIALARISHTPCGLRRRKRATGQEGGAERTGSTVEPSDAPCRAPGPARRVAFRRPATGAGRSTV